MAFLIAGLLVFWLASVGLKGFVRANPKVLARWMRSAGGAAAIAGALAMLLRGQVDLALLLGGVGAWLTTGRSLKASMIRPKRSRVRQSRVRSAMIEMELDHQSGAMSGMVLAGPDEGESLDRLTRPRCFDLYRVCLSDDPEGARLLEAYFDRRFAGWREAEHDGRDPRAGGGPAGGRRPGGMSEDEAHEILGLGKSATREEITRAHRALMKKLHPDHGGSTDLAARVNEAKDVLLRRHP